MHRGGWTGSIIGAVPRYALEIHEPDGSLTKGEHTSPGGEWYTESHEFDHEGRRLHVRQLKEAHGEYVKEAQGEYAHGKYDQLLICVPL